MTAVIKAVIYVIKLLLIGIGFDVAIEEASSKYNIDGKILIENVEKHGYYRNQDYKNTDSNDYILYH